MLAKVLKKQEAATFMPFSFPEIGEPKSQPKSVNEFVVPRLDEFQFEEQIIETEPFDSLDAEDILQNARNEAARILAQAEANGEIIEQVAQEKAVHEAKAGFETEVAERVAEIRGQLAETIKEISALSEEITARAENDLVELALQIAKKIVGREVTIDREIALTLVKVSLGKLHNRAVAEVHLNPEDFAFVEAHREKLDFRGSLELVEDRSISVGGCLIHTETGDIDARIKSQFDEIAYGLLN
jgi:flagellar assembly protein FliH